MAKTKKAKKEDNVDLTPKPDKVTEEQLTKIQGVVDNINRTHMNVGQLEARKHQVLHMIAGTNDELTMMQENLQKEYGTNDINIKNGTINYPAENGEVNS